MFVLAPIRKRSDFLLAAQSGFKYVKPCIVIQVRKRYYGSDTNTDSLIRTGFTATRRIGGAVIRNRAKRRMRAAVRAALAEFGVEGCDYVFIARDNLVKVPFATLAKELRHSLKKLAEQLVNVAAETTAKAGFVLN